MTGVADAAEARVKPAPVAIALGVGAIAFAIAFVVPAFAGTPVAWYSPTEHDWTFVVKPPGVWIDFYGRVLQALLAWVVASAGTYAIARRCAAIGARALGLCAAWALTATVFVMMFYAWTLHYRVPVPAPLPATTPTAPRPAG